MPTIKHNMFMRQPRHFKSFAGFTLIELMIVVAIVAVLAAVAFPSYQFAMVKNRRAEAQTVLADIAQRQQQYLLDNRAYADNVTTLNVVTPASVSQNYTLSIVLGTATLPSFTATATPIVGKPQASDVVLNLTSTGIKTPADRW